MIVAGLLLLTSADAGLAQGADTTDRKMEMEINRDRAESRIERLHEDRARARAQKNKSNKKSRKTPKSLQEHLRF